MATRALSAPQPRSIGRSVLLTLPIVLWSALMFTPAFGHANRAQRIAAILTGAFMVVLFFLMMRTWKTYRWRRWFFEALGLLFPVGFIHNVMVMRGTMGIPIEEMIAGRTPFCYLPIPLLILPAAFTKTLVFPGSILPGGGMSGAGMAAMAGIWLAITIVVGKGWCSYACFFGGIEEGMASIPAKAKLRKIDRRWRYGPWAVLLAMVLLSLALFEPAYCMWLCPFKAVSEYVAARNTVGLVQNGIFVALFAGLVIGLPLMTKKRTQCAFFCPFGAFQSIFNKTSVFDVKIDSTRCTPCLLCQKSCPTMSLTDESIARGETLMSCMKCGACVDACPKDAVVWHIRGTEVAVKPERARLMFLYAAWAMAIMFGGSIIAEGVATILHVLL
ncbi:MAG TPA: 4Fe-4S binding protein [Candidatus Sulfotelmatobacter sp.]|nr:4Fe-4S binding protein [Candidatus Sulfotelmatobacter sp.]